MREGGRGEGGGRRGRWCDVGVALNQVSGLFWNELVYGVCDILRGKEREILFLDVHH